MMIILAGGQFLIDNIASGPKMAHILVGHSFKTVQQNSTKLYTKFFLHIFNHIANFHSHWTTNVEMTVPWKWCVQKFNIVDTINLEFNSFSIMSSNPCSILSSNLFSIMSSNSFFIMSSNSCSIVSLNTCSMMILTKRIDGLSYFFTRWFRGRP